MLMHTLWEKRKKTNTNPNSPHYLTKEPTQTLLFISNGPWFSEIILSHECSSVGAVLRVCRSSPLFWSERKDSGSLVGERRGRKGNQATWANTWGSARALCTQMCTQLRLPGNRRRLCFSLISSSISFSFSLFCLSLSLFLFLFSHLFCLSLFSFTLYVGHSVSPSHLGDYSKIMVLKNRASH